MVDKNTRIVGKLIGYIEKILTYCQNSDADGFVADTKLVEACVFNMIQIGESTRLLDDEYIAAHHEIPWHKMRGLRNRIVHDYEGIDLSLIWDIVSRDLPELSRRLREIDGR